MQPLSTNPMAIFQSQTNILPPASQRRLDSIAYLIQGNTACGAMAFDGAHLILATNDPYVKQGDDPKEVQTIHDQLIDKVKQFLQDIAETSHNAQADHSVSQKALKLAHNRSAENLEYFVKSNVSLYTTNKIYRKHFQKALSKVCLAIRHSYFKDIKAYHDILPWDLVEAIRCGSILLFIGHDPKLHGVHAELKVLQFLHSNKKSLHSIYIGISKKTCLNCENTIAAYNECSKLKVISNPEAQEESEENVLFIREEGHKNPFRAVPPPFFTTDLKLQIAFLEKNHVRPTYSTSKNAKFIQQFFSKSPSGHVSGGEQLLTDSDSPTCTSEKPRGLQAR